jgi:hypothetical protein
MIHNRNGFYPRRTDPINGPDWTYLYARIPGSDWFDLGWTVQVEDMSARTVPGYAPFALDAIHDFASQGGYPPDYARFWVWNYELQTWVATDATSRELIAAKSAQLAYYRNPGEKYQTVT